MAGEVFNELNAQGDKTKSYVYAAGGRLAKHEPANAIAPVAWYVTEPLTGDWGEAKSNGDFMGDRGANLDPLGADTPPNDPYLLDPTPTYIESRPNEPLYIDGGDPFDLSGGCTLDGLPVSCNFVSRSGEAQVALKGSTPTTVWNGDSFVFFQAGINSIGYYAMGSRERITFPWDIFADRSLVQQRQPQQSAGQQEGRNENTTCRVMLGSRPLNDELVGTTLGFHHMFVTAKQSNESVAMVWHAFPGAIDRAGLLTGRVNRFEKGDDDYDQFNKGGVRGVSSFSITIDGSCDEARRSFDTSLAAINAKKYKYPSKYENATNPTTNLTNSNAFAYTLLLRWNSDRFDQLRLGIKRGLDLNRTPGWGTNLLP